MKVLKKILSLHILLYIILNNFAIVYADNFTYKLHSNQIFTNADSVVVMDADTNVVIYEKNGETKRYPASITKIMTALLLIEHVEAGRASYSDTITYSKEAIYAVPYSGTNIGQQPGTSLTIEQSLYSLMLPSANEIANGIGEYLAGSMDEFGVMMTKRANDLGAVNTNFVNASGLHDDNHYTTALDMALIMDKAKEYDKFVEVAGTYNYKFSRLNADGKTVELDLYNSNRMISQSNLYYDEHVVAGKTGYTTPAKHTLVTYSEVDGHKIIISVLHANKYEPYKDTTSLLNYYGNKYHDITLSELPLYTTLDVYNVATDEIINELTAKTAPKTINVPSSVSTFDFDYEDTTNSKTYAPVALDEVVGTADFFLNDTFRVQTELIAIHDVKDKGNGIFAKLFNIVRMLFIVILYILGLFLLSILPIRHYNKIRNKKLKQAKLLAEDPRVQRKYRKTNKSRRKKTTKK